MRWGVIGSFESKPDKVLLHFFFVFIILCIYFGCSGSSLLQRLFSSCDELGLLFRGSVQASHCRGFSCCGAWALGQVGFSNCSSQALEHRLNSCGHGLNCSSACGIFLAQGSNPCLLHWQVDSFPLTHQGSPCPIAFYEDHSGN